MNPSIHKAATVFLGFCSLFAVQRAGAAPYVITEVMSGLVTPRGLAFGPDGGLYVAEAGSGGSGPSVVLGNGATAFLGDTSGLSRLLGGVQTRVLNGLPSVATPAGLDAGGLQDIAFDGSGQAYGLFSFGSDALQRNNNLGAAGASLGTVAKLPLGGGTLQHVADITAHEFASNPAGGALDSNPFRMALHADGSVLVADAGANDFLQATSGGVVSTLGVLSAKPNPLPFGPPVYQSVPTAIEIGPDGAYYIGQLTGFPFPPGAANVYRYDPATSTITEAFTGFTNIIDLAFDTSGMLYVLQVSSNGLASPLGPGSGLLLQVDPTTGIRTTIASDGLVFPGGVTVGPDGALYVTNHSNVPTGGQVLRIAAVPEPSSLALAVGGIGLVCVYRGRRAFVTQSLSGACTMKRRTVLVALALIAVSHLAVAADRATDEKAIRQVVKVYETLWNTHDMSTFGDLFTDDAEWVNVVGHVWRGKADIKKAHQFVHETNFKNRNMQLDNMTVRFIRPDVAVSIVRWTLDGFEAPDGRQFPKGPNVATLVFVKQSGNWLISSGENVTVDPVAAKFDPVKQ